MKKLLRIFLYAAALIILIAAGFFIYFQLSYPKVDPPMDISVELTKERIERGKYLAEHVAVCMDCHSGRDWSKFSGPIAEGTLGMGGESFGEEMGIPGRVTPKNITPASLKTWKDGEIIRAITCGVNKDNDVIFPIMPYSNYNQLAEEDLYSIVAYIKSLQPKENKIPERELNFPLNFLIKTMAIEKYTPKESPSKSDKINYGKYILTIASCRDCHTPSVEGEPVPGMDLAGGTDFKLPFGTIRPANLTPDKETGIGNWSREDFIKRFKYYDTDSTRSIPVKMSDFNSVMPWTLYAGMTEEDLGAIYDYLQTVKPVKNRVQKWSPAQQTLSKN